MRSPRTPAASPLRRLARLELLPLLLLVLLAGGVFGFLELAEEVQEGDTRTLDEALLLALREPGDRTDPLGPPWFEELARDVTALGGFGFLSFLTVAIAGFLVLERKRRAALLMLLAVFGGQLLSNVLKDAFGRPRPSLVPHAVHVVTASFPSGHAMLSAVTYLTLAALLARVQPRRRSKLCFLTLGLLLTLLVGASRVYLGVHWPSDVLAGWTAGGAWALLCWLVAFELQRHGEVERPGPEPETPEPGA